MSKRVLRSCSEVVLVAHEPPNSEHLGIRLVAAGLVEAGFLPRVLPLLSPSSLAATVGETLAAHPFLVGVSLSDPLVAPLLLAFVRLLRQRGYAGHITAGGALATLDRSNLLAAHAAIDSIVRHAGEGTIVELAHALCRDRGLDEVPGLTTRRSEGRGNPNVLAPSRLWPLRTVEPPTLIGIPKADIAASRGCAGHCAYCGVSALARELAHEHRLLGLDPAHARGSLRRPIDDLADEVAALYHERGVRVVQLVAAFRPGAGPGRGGPGRAGGAPACVLRPALQRPARPSDLARNVSGDTQTGAAFGLPLVGPRARDGHGHGVRWLTFRGLTFGPARREFADRRAAPCGCTRGVSGCPSRRRRGCATAPPQRAVRGGRRTWRRMRC